MPNPPIGMISVEEAYSKYELMRRLGISQPFWDTMLNEGLPYASIGHARWVTGKDVIEYMVKHSERKSREHDDESER